jgi:hypothetical protein
MFFIALNQWLAGRFTLPQGMPAIMSAIRERAVFVQNAGKAEKMGLTWA